MVPALVPAELASLTLVTMLCRRILQGAGAVLAILVRQLGYAGPGVLLNVFASREDRAVEVMKGLRWILRRNLLDPGGESLY